MTFPDLFESDSDRIWRAWLPLTIAFSCLQTSLIILFLLLRAIPLFMAEWCVGRAFPASIETYPVTLHPLLLSWCMGFLVYPRAFQLPAGQFATLPMEEPGQLDLEGQTTS